MKNRTLVAWIGATDLASMANDLGGTVKTQVEKAIKRKTRESDDGGPIRSLVDNESFDSIHLINSYPKSLEPKFAKWLGLPISFYRPEDLKGPTDYASIFTTVDEFLRQLYDSDSTRPSELCIHLSPGTPAMAAIWVLLGKSKYKATFFQSYQGKSSTTEIPFDLDLHIRDVITDADTAYEHLRAMSPGELKGFSDMIGDSKSMREAVGRAHRSAVRDVSVLLLGESGTGKSRIAQAIHDSSRRSEKPFRSINCAAIPDQLLESELFGHVKGAFTGADKAKKGLFEEADGGTMFLDEIGECNLELQAKLLSVLQPLTEQGLCVRKFRPVGGTKEVTVDVRVIAATNQNLIQQVEDNEFRLDLYYRLAAITIKLPPLRERGRDIVDLANHFLSEINQDFSRDDSEFEPKKLSSDAVSFIRSHHWPGNARQLYNAILQAVVMTARKNIGRADLAASVEEAPGRSGGSAVDRDLGNGFCLPKHLESIQKHYLKRGMDEANGKKREAAELLGFKNWQTMDKQLTKFGIK
ncbi:MAG: sigma 54-interacting transcriptional regulator [Planctomycetota bacterium]